jgi:hypothetical protein
MKSQLPGLKTAGKLAADLPPAGAIARMLVPLMIFAGLLVCFVSTAVGSPDVPAPGWEAFGALTPTNLSPGSSGVLNLFVYNTGAAPSVPGATVRDALPEGLEAEPTGSCSGTKVVTCELGEVQPTPEPVELEIPVKVLPGASAASHPVDLVSVSGGGASGPADARVPVVFAPGEAGFGFANADAWVTNANGTADTQAGSHPYELTVVFALNTHDIPGYELAAGGEPHALNVSMPPGIVGEPGAVPQCPREQFDAGTESGEGCPADTEIGEDIALVPGASAKLVVYNLVPPAGVAAEFGFDFNGTHVFLDAKVRSGGDYGITEHVSFPQEGVRFNSLTIWGEPGEHGTGAPIKPFLTMPTSCGRSLPVGLEMVGTWQNPASNAQTGFLLHNSEGGEAQVTGCERLSNFEPSISLAPETSFSDTPTGLTTRVKIPQGLNPEGLATSALRETTVVLPKGVAINPGQATGLVACPAADEGLPLEGQDGEMEAFDGPPDCPAASKVGTDEISTPLLPNRLKGNVYILQNNPPELQLLVAASGEGVNLKLIGTVHLDKETGQITTTFKGTKQYPGTPDAPLNEFVLSFSGGAQAALVTPPTCGVYYSDAVFTPWAAPAIASGLSESNFQITGGPESSGSAGCTAPLPFAPVLTAGSTTDQAAGYTGFSMLLQRGDGQQRVQKLQFKTPEGLLGMISKVTLCPEPQASMGDCPESSQIGHTVVGAGPGPYPLFIPQAGAPPAPIFLTESYEGAPYGLSIKVPIVAGPFTLETQVVRAKIEVDPHTAQLTITTDPLPSIVDGIPADLRSINAVIDKPGFMFNPTNCDPTSFSGTATSVEGQTAPISSPFQVGSCQGLVFKPNFKLSTQSTASRPDGASLEAKIVYPTTPLGANQASSQANIASVKVELPKQLPSRLTTLQKACPAAQFEVDPAGCPAASLVGHASAVTPVLPVALVGPAYFVSHGGQAFPSLIVVLQGYGVTVDLVGTTFISKRGITSSTFKEVPDVPISSFDLTLPKGPYSALTANLPAKAKGSFCGQKLTIPTIFTAQNGAVIHQSTPIAVKGCTNTKKAKHHNTKKNHKRTHKPDHKSASGQRHSDKKARQ